MVRLLRYSFPSFDFTSLTGNYPVNESAMYIPSELSRQEQLRGHLSYYARGQNCGQSFLSDHLAQTAEVAKQGTHPPIDNCKANQISRTFAFTTSNGLVEGRRESSSVRSVTWKHWFSSIVPGICSASSVASRLNASLSLVFIHSEPLKYFSLVSFPFTYYISSLEIEKQYLHLVRKERICSHILNNLIFVRHSGRSKRTATYQWW